MSNSTLSAPFLIWSLSEELLSLNRPKESISLLGTLLSSISLVKEPMIEIKTRVRLGDLMTRYGADWDAAEGVLMKGKLMMDEMNYSEIQKYPDYTQIKLQLLHSLIALYEYKGSYQEAKKMLRYAINYLTEEQERTQKNAPTNIETNTSSTSNAALLLKYNDAFHFNLVKVLFRLSEYSEAYEVLQYFDEQSPPILQLIAQITRLHLMMTENPVQREEIAAFSRDIWEQMKAMLPGMEDEDQMQDDTDAVTQSIQFWTQNYSLLHQFCRYWLLNALYWVGAGNWYPSQNTIKEVSETSTGSLSDMPETSDPSSLTAFSCIAEFKRYFSLLTSLINEQSDLSQRDTVDEFLSVHDLHLFELLLEVLQLRTSQLKQMKEIKKALQTSQSSIDKLMDRLRQCFDLKGYRMDPKTESRMHLFISLKILLEYNNCLYNLYRGHLSSSAEGIGQIMEILETYPALFSTYMYDVHILAGLYFIQCGEVEHAEQHFELVRKGCALSDPYTAAWATVYLMITLLNTPESGDLRDITPETRDRLFSILDRTEREEIFTVDTLQTALLFVKGCVYYSTGAIDDANQYMRRANEVVRITKNDEARAQQDLLLGMTFNQQGNANQTSRFVKHSMQLAARGKAFYILQLGSAEHSEMNNVNVGQWKAATFKQIESYLQGEREKAAQFEEKLVNWFPHMSEEYFAAREHELGKQ